MDFERQFKDGVIGELDVQEQKNPYHWDSLTLASLMPAPWVANARNTISSLNQQIDIKQRQVNDLVKDTLNVIDNIDRLSNDLKKLEKDITDYLSNFFNAGAHYRILGFDAEISSNGELNRELERVLNPAIFGPSGTNPDPNFPNFTGDTARLGGFLLLFAAPSKDKILEQFKNFGKYFTGLGEGFLGGKEAFLKSVKKTKDQFKDIPQLKLNWKKQFDDFKENNKKLVDLKQRQDDYVPITDTDKWHGLNLAQLIPALDPLKIGSPANLAMDAIEQGFAQAQNLFNIVDGARDAVNRLNQDIRSFQSSVNAAQDFVTDIVEGIFDTGIYFHAYGAEYNIRSTTDYIRAIMDSVNDTTDSNRPTFEGDTLFVGGVLAVVGGPDYQGFSDSFQSFSNTFKSIGLSTDSWGRSFNDAKDFTPEGKDAIGKTIGTLSILPPNTIFQSPVSNVIIQELEARILISDSVPESAEVDAFLIKDEDIPPVSAGETVEYISANNISVITQADIKGNVTVTVLSNGVVTIKKSNEYTATNSSQVTTILKKEISFYRVFNYFAGEHTARDDGSIVSRRAEDITVFFSDGAVSQIDDDGSSTTTRADGTVETVTVNGIKTVTYTTGVVKVYDSDGNLVKMSGPEDEKEQLEINSGTTEYLEDGSIKYIDSEGIITITSLEADGSTSTIKQYPDGTQEITKADGTKIVISQTEKTTTFTDGRQKVELIESWDAYGIEYTGDIIWIETDGTQRKINKDKSEEITLPDGTVTVIYSDGSSKTTMPDGTIRSIGPDGTITEIKKGGTRVISFPDGKVQQIQPDGSYVIINPDGSVETGKVEGEVVIENPDGSISYVKSEGLVVSKQLDGTIEKDNEKTGQTVTITPTKITTTQADGTIVEVTDTRKKTTDTEGNVVIEETSIRIGTEVVDGAEREVAFKVTKTITIKATGEQTITEAREAIYDIIRVVSASGTIKKLETPAIRKVQDKNIVTISKFDKTLDIRTRDNKGKTIVFSTDKKSGEVTISKVNTEKLRGSSIDSSSEFEG